MSSFNLGDLVLVRNKMQPFYSFGIVAERGQNYTPYFTPKFTPNEMLRLGVFEGHYMTDCQSEYPEEMFLGARINPAKADVQGCNAFKAKSRNPLSEWKMRGWLSQNDPRGWFEWYCRYWTGRRDLDDERQIQRWMRFRPRWEAVIVPCGGDITKRRVTRQALLQWSHDPLPDIPTLAGETIADKAFRVLGIKR